MPVMTLTNKQLLLIEASLEYSSRIGSGQICHISDLIDLCHGKMREVKTPSGTMAWLQLGRHVEDMIKPILFPELECNASYGVGNKEIPNGTIMYEMYKKIQNYRVSGKSGMGVMSHEPLKLSKEPLITIKDDNEPERADTKPSKKRTNNATRGAKPIRRVSLAIKNKRT